MIDDFAEFKERRDNAELRGVTADIIRLEQLIKAIPQLTSSDQSLLTGALDAYRGLLVLGKFFKLAVILLAGISAFAVGFDHIKVALRNWLS